MPMLIAGSGAPMKPPVIVTARQKTAARRRASINGLGISQPVDASNSGAADAAAPTGTLIVAPMPRAANVRTRVAPHAKRYIQNGTGSVEGPTSGCAAAAVGTPKTAA